MSAIALFLCSDLFFYLAGIVLMAELLHIEYEHETLYSICRSRLNDNTSKEQTEIKIEKSAFRLNWLIGMIFFAAKQFQ